jgi:hypothetical protein
MLGRCLYAIKPMGMGGDGASACELVVAKPWHGFAIATRVQVHTTSNADTGRPEGPQGGWTG